MLFAYRPRQAIVLALYTFFVTPTSGGIPSNFPALARKLQDLQNGIEPTMAYSAEAPQERDIDIRTMNRKVQTALERLDPDYRNILAAAYSMKVQDPMLEDALSSRLVGLARYSKIADGKPERFFDDPTVMRVVRNELEEIWREAHVEFEKAFKQC